MMQRIRHALLAVVLLAAVAVVDVTIAPVASAAGPTITGTGSSYAAVAIDQWVAQMQSIYGDSINYQTSSSVIGLNDYAQKQVDFGASEIGYSTGQANDVPPSGTYQYLPNVAGATCFMYNLTGSVGNHVTNLRLDSAVVAGIFTGRITRWNDAKLKALNPAVPLPDKPIVTVFRTDASGENYLLGDYLNDTQHAAYAAYTRTLGFPTAPQALWPYPQEGGSSGSYDFSNWVGQSGSDNSSNYVGSTTSSITYVETAYAILHHEPCAALRNASGHFVQPSQEADAIALEKAELLPDLEQKLSGVYANTLAGAYPMSAYSYLVVPLSPKGRIDPAKGKVLGRFVNYLACAGQQAAGQLGYSPLPPNLVEEDLRGIAHITGAAAPPPLTAQNCKNPYVDGQTPLPGEPRIAGGGAPVPRTVSSRHVSAAGVAGSGGVGSGATAGARATGARGSAVAGLPGAAAVTASGGRSVSGLYPGEQIVRGLGTGSQVGRSFVGADLQAAARGVGLGSTAGGVFALLLTAGLAAGSAYAVIRARRTRRSAP
jgi:phosphate transport system substrate-binding protein